MKEERKKEEMENGNPKAQNMGANNKEDRDQKDTEHTQDGEKGDESETSRGEGNDPGPTGDRGGETEPSENEKEAPEGERQQGPASSSSQKTEEKDSKDEKIEALEDKYLRLFSEFDNYKKRTKKEKAEIIRNASGDVIKDILPVLDDFDRAIRANEENEVTEEKLKEGFELIYNKLKGILEKKGLQEMEAKGKPFNMEEHEAMTKAPAPSEEEKGKVIEEVEKGYYLNDKVLRFAKVVVGE